MPRRTMVVYAPPIENGEHLGGCSPFCGAASVDNQSGAEGAAGVYSYPQVRM